MGSRSCEVNADYVLAWTRFKMNDGREGDGWMRGWGTSMGYHARTKGVSGMLYGMIRGDQKMANRFCLGLLGSVVR